MRIEFDSLDPKWPQTSLGIEQIVRDSQTEKQIIWSKFGEGRFGGKTVFFFFLRRIGGDDKHIWEKKGNIHRIMIMSL